VRFQKLEGTNSIREVLYTRSTWAIRKGKEAHSACAVDGYVIRVRHYKRRNFAKVLAKYYFGGGCGGCDGKPT